MSRPGRGRTDFSCTDGDQPRVVDLDPFARQSRRSGGDDEAQGRPQAGEGGERPRIHVVGAGSALDLPGLLIRVARAARERWSAKRVGVPLLGYALGARLAPRFSLRRFGAVPAGQREEIAGLAPDVALLPVNDARRPDERGFAGNFSVEEALTLPGLLRSRPKNSYGMFAFNT